jgi:hypothetical protein
MAAAWSGSTSGPYCFSSYYGGVYCYYLDFGTLTITDSAISGNFAQRFGGGVQNILSTVTIENSIISGNKSTWGGGAFNGGGGYYDDFGKYIPRGSLSLVDSTITQNLAYQSGGGLFNYGSLNMTNSVISNNQAPVGPDIFP